MIHLAMLFGSAAVVGSALGWLVGWAMKRALRDRFAAAALPFFQCVEVGDIDTTKLREGETTDGWIARRCFEAADALMKARSA